MCDWCERAAKKKWLRCGEVICSSSSANLCVSIRYQYTLQSKGYTHSITQDKIGFSRIGYTQWSICSIERAGKKEREIKSEPIFLCAGRKKVEIKYKKKKLRIERLRFCIGFPHK